MTVPVFDKIGGEMHLDAESIADFFTFSSMALTGEEIARIEGLVSLTRLPPAALTPGESHPYKTLLTMEPMLRRGLGHYIESDEFLFLMSGTDINRFNRAAWLYPNDTVEEALAYVQQCRVLPGRFRDPRCDHASHLTKDLLEAEAFRLQGKNACGLLYGSIHYGDPSLSPDIDFDLLVLPRGNRDYEVFEAFVSDINAAISQHGYGADIGIIDVCDIFDSIQAVQSGDWSKGFDIYGALTLLTGELVDIPLAENDPVREQVLKIRNLLIEAAGENPLLNLLVCGDLRGVVEIDRFKERPARRRFEQARSAHE